ncbi:uncharacterized protein [Amphiura filiformis]|uniref:uncharacterized protein n=1 Tax=Amphiura filiformis TaxID=82378 RepID=UPI003B227328
MATQLQEIHHLQADSLRLPLGNLPVSPRSPDENQRDLLFPPWLDALPTPPYHLRNGNNHGNAAVVHTPRNDATNVSPTSTRHVQIYEDVTTQEYRHTPRTRRQHQEQQAYPVSVTFNPDTPPKTPESGVRSDSSKRKRDAQDEGTPKRDYTDGSIVEGTLFKKPKSLKVLQESTKGALRLHLLSLSSSQLVNLVTDLVEANPELRQDVTSQLPEPDLTPQLKRLSHLMHNVYRALPRTRLGSTRGALCYRRVRVHLSSFKKCCLQQGRHLLRCLSWKAAIEYSLTAWQYTANLPIWDNPAHNRIRQCCFQGLAAIFIKALKNGQLDLATLKSFRARMLTASIADDVMEICIDRLDSVLQA